MNFSNWLGVLVLCRGRMHPRFRWMRKIVALSTSELSWTVTLSCNWRIQMFIFHNVTITDPANFTQCTTRGSFVTHWQETAYNMFTFSWLFLLPLAIMITCYSRIFIHISEQMTKKNVSSDEPHLRCSKNNIPKARMRTLKMSIVIVVSFIVCWTPYYLLGLWYWFFPDDLEGKVSHSLTHILFIFGLFNTCLDPIIYGLFTVRFNRRLRNNYSRATIMSGLDTNMVAVESVKYTLSALPSKGGSPEGENDNWGQNEQKSADCSF